MTPNEKKIQDMHRDILFVLSHPDQVCKICTYGDRDCKIVGCTPQWRGDKNNEHGG